MQRRDESFRPCLMREYIEEGAHSISISLIRSARLFSDGITDQEGGGGRRREEEKGRKRGGKGRRSVVV